MTDHIAEHTVPLGSSSSQLLVGRGSSRALMERLADEAPRFLVVSDHNVMEAWAETLFPGPTWLSVPAGEASKSVERLQELWSSMLGRGLDRSSGLLAVGGGVVGDLAGFAAATYMRGIKFYSVPTSLLAMVDASVGGKVGIDLPEGKNLVGQFYPARVVAVDPELLATLPDSEWACGMAEVIKHAMLSGAPLWEELQSFTPQNRADPAKLDSLVAMAVGVKVRVVTEDPYEKTGLRATLNLGHTYGHAIEWCADFSVSHGSAVALGLLAGLRLSREMGLLEQNFEESLTSLLRRWGLPVSLPTREMFRWERVAEALARDKKNKDGKWCFVLPVRVGEVTTVYGPPRSLVERAFESLFAVGSAV